MKRIWIVVAATVVLLFAVLGFAVFRHMWVAEFLASRPEPVVAVSAVEAEKTEWEKTISGIGVFEAVHGSLLSSSAAGLVKEIAFDSGQKVEAGQKLVSLDADVERANLEQSEARVKLNALTLERTRSLRQTDAASQARLDQATADLRAAQAEAESYRAIIAKKTVAAPFSGVAGIVRVKQGEYVQPGQAIVSVHDLSEMLLTVTVSQSSAPNLGMGQTVRAFVSAYPDHAFEGSVLAVEPAVDAAGLLKIQAYFDNRGGLLRPGMFAKATILLSGRDHAVALPQTAISFSLYGDSVFVVEKDEEGVLRARRRDVKTGRRDKGAVMILDGVEPGEQVVAAGGQKLSNGTKIKLVDSPILGALPAIGHE